MLKEIDNFLQKIEGKKTTTRKRRTSKKGVSGTLNGTRKRTTKRKPATRRKR